MYIYHDGCVVEEALNSHQGYFPTIASCMAASCLALADEGALPTLGWSKCLQGWALPQQGGVGEALPLPTDVGCRADTILKELPSGREQSPLLCSSGAEEPGEERAWVFEQQPSKSLVPGTLDWCLTACGVQKEQNLSLHEHSNYSF